MAGDRLHPCRIAVLGAGNGGVAIAGYLASQGHQVRLWNRTPERLRPFRDHSEIVLRGAVSARGRLAVVTESIEEAIRGASVVMVATTSDAHEALGVDLATYAEDGQVYLLNPGRTGGAMAMWASMTPRLDGRRVFVAEAQSLVYACRASGCEVNVIGAKTFVPVAAYPTRHTLHVVQTVRPLFGCFEAAPSVLHTGLENIGAMFHPAIVVFNAATIERGQPFYFYQDMTPRIAAFLGRIDDERLALGRAFGLRLHALFDWIKLAYPATEGDTLCDRLRNNPAYHEIAAPTQLRSRLLTEDVPTGLVPMCSLGEAVGVAMPLMRSLVDLSNALLDVDFWATGRTLDKLGLAGMSATEILGHFKETADHDTAASR
jgi:opine dehydrogenase